MGRGRTPEAWYWEERKGWYVVIAGKRRLLAKGREKKAEAKKALHRILGEEDSSGTPKVDALDLHAVIDYFLVRVRLECKDSTLTFYRSQLEPFAGFVGKIPAAELRIKHVDQYLASEGSHWSDSSRRQAITAVKAMSSWATKRGYLAVDHLKGMSRPRMGRRAAASPELAAKMLESAGDEVFRDLLIALIESGCRPGEAYKVTAADVDLVAGTWTVRGKTTSQTGRDRVIYLTPKLIEITRRLVGRHPDGPLFRNSRGGPWNDNAVRSRFLLRRESLGKAQAYGLRHLFGTDALTRQVPVGVVAALMGHSDLKMLMDHYGHVDERAALLRAAASAVRPSSAGGSGEPESPAPTPEASGEAG